MKHTTRFLGSLVFVCAFLLPLQLHARSAQSQELACVSGNCNKDIRDLHKLARHGSTEAMTLLSMIYAIGWLAGLSPAVMVTWVCLVWVAALARSLMARAQR